MLSPIDSDALCLSFKWDAPFHSGPFSFGRGRRTVGGVTVTDRPWIYRRSCRPPTCYDPGPMEMDPILVRLSCVLAAAVHWLPEKAGVR
jgi:hypothetical protein